MSASRTNVMTEESSERLCDDHGCIAKLGRPKRAVKDFAARGKDASNLRRVTTLPSLSCQDHVACAIVWAARSTRSAIFFSRFHTMTTPGGPTNYSSMTDAELRALEKDGSLSPAAWQEVIDELRRRSQTAPRPGAPAAAGPAPSAAPVAAMSPPARPSDDDPRLAQAVQHLTALLVSGESLVAYAVQRRLFALLHRRIVVAATTGRLIQIHRGIFGGYSPVDMRWQDIENANLRVGIFGADLTITSRGRQDLASSGPTAGTIVSHGPVSYTHL